MAGATRRIVAPKMSNASSPAGSSSYMMAASPDAFSLPPPLPVSAVVPEPVVPESGVLEPVAPLVFVSALAQPATPRASLPDIPLNSSGYRTFEGRVASLVVEREGDAPRAVLMMTSRFGEHFRCILSPRTAVYSGDDHKPPARPIAPGDTLFVKYLLLKENTAIEVRID